MASSASTSATSSQAPTGSEECVPCRYGRTALRALLFTGVGLVLALAVSWVTVRVPILGVVLGIVSVLLIARALMLTFTRPNPLVALAHLGASLAIGFVIVLLVRLLVG